MIEKISDSEEYNNLKIHVKRLLEKARSCFESKKNFFLYQAYLVVTSNYKKRIIGVDTSLQQLLADPHKFWLSPALDNDHTELKRDVIRFIILQELNLAISTATFATSNLDLNAFVASQINKLSSRFATSNLENIFSHNLNFTLPRQSNHIIMIGKIASMAFAVTLVTLNLSTIHDLNSGLIDFVLQTQNLLLENLPPRDQIRLDNMVKSSSTLTCLLLGWSSSKIVARNFKSKMRIDSSWEKINLSEFVTSCQEESALASLIPKNQGISPFWYSRSPLSVHPNKTPVFFRNYLHYELKGLSDEMDFKEFCKLLTCILKETPPTLTDLPYSVPVDILLDPQKAWTANTKLSEKNCHALLQNYAKLAFADFLKDELKTKKIYGSKKQEALLCILSEQSKKIQQQLVRINETKLSSNTKSFNHLPKMYAFFMVAFLLNFAISAYTIASISTTDQESKNSTLNYVFDHILSFVSFVAASPRRVVMTGVLAPLVIKKFFPDSSGAKTDKVTATTRFFVQNTIKKSPDLQAIFENEPKKLGC